MVRTHFSTPFTSRLHLLTPISPAMWDYPTEPGIANITGSLSKTLTSSPITSFLLGSFVEALDVTGLDRVDVASWTIGKQMLVSIVNKEYVDKPTANVSITFPGTASAVGQTLWGSSWSISGGQLFKVGLDALEVDMLVVEME